MGLSVVVTVGMGRFPFDRLLEAVAPLCDRHDVFVQRGPSRVPLVCEAVDYLDPRELEGRIRAADVVITHAGNTVRLAQRLGRVPIAVARERRRGEMADDHQVAFLREEERVGALVALWGNLGDLHDAVLRHRAREAQLASRLPRGDPAGPEAARAVLDALLAGGAVGPFARSSTRRWTYAARVLSDASGPHLDVGVGAGEFLTGFAPGARRTCVGVDVHHGYLAELCAAHPGLVLARIGHRDPLPFADGSFGSVSLLDTLEHVPAETSLLREVRRVLRPGGVVVVTVPARHVFSFLDPGNAKLRFPRLHRIVYTARRGRARYEERFVDLADGLRGDLSVERDEHTNYLAPDLLDLLCCAGLEPVARDGANLFWRWLQVPQLLLPGTLARALDVPLRWDGLAFHQANLFLLARRPA